MNKYIPWVLLTCLLVALWLAHGVSPQALPPVPSKPIVNKTLFVLNIPKAEPIKPRKRNFYWYERRFDK